MEGKRTRTKWQGRHRSDVEGQYGRRHRRRTERECPNLCIVRRVRRTGVGVTVGGWRLFLPHQIRQSGVGTEGTVTGVMIRLPGLMSPVPARGGTEVASVVLSRTSPNKRSVLTETVPMSGAVDVILRENWS